MKVLPYKLTLPRGVHAVLTILHLLVLLASAAMIVWITRDTLRSVSFLTSPEYLRFQFWVCLLFLVDVAAEIAVAPRRWHYIVAHLFFILISIPWLNLIDFLGIRLDSAATYAMQFVPMIRAGYVLALVSGALTSRKALSWCNVYVIWMVASLFFATLMFFVVEHKVNPGVGTFWDALWWASMSLTTAGSSINELTITGKALSIFLSAEGLILFPVFTVYITQAVTEIDKTPTASTPPPAE